MAKKDKNTRLLIRDQHGVQHKLVTIQFQQQISNNTLLICLPNILTHVRIFKDDQTKEIKKEIPNAHTTHISYHQTGLISLACYDENSNKIRETLGELTQNLPLHELEPARCFLKISPFSIEKFPVETRSKRDTDIDLLADAVFPHGLESKPFEIHFWIGKGSVDDIEDKINVIRWFHIRQSLFNSAVHGLQHDKLDLQIFIAIVLKTDADEFPIRTGVRIYTNHESGFLKLKNDAPLPDVRTSVA